VHSHLSLRQGSENTKAVLNQLHALAYRVKESSTMDSKLPPYQPVDVEIEPPPDAAANAVSSITELYSPYA